MLNEVTLIGNVGGTPAFHTFADGRENASFSLATTEKWTDKTTMEKREKTEWHNIVISAPNLISVVRSYVSKGAKLLIKGAIHYREWTDKEGVKKSITEIVVGMQGRLLLLGGKPNNEVIPSTVAKTNTPQKVVIDFEDDAMPF